MSRNSLLRRTVTQPHLRREEPMNPTTRQQMPEITATELKQRLDSGEDIQIIDVREPDEVVIAKIPNSVHIPLAQIMGRVAEIDPNRASEVHCMLVGRSHKEIDWLKRSGVLGNLNNLSGSTSQ